MKILVTNDDGIHADGIKILVDLARKYGEVVVVAPKVEQSAKSHGINVHSGIDVVEVKDLFGDVKTYIVDSTPADCVRFAHYYLGYDFDVVFSGVNSGYNLGEDIMYSGTVAAASEALFCKKKGLAFSTDRNNFTGVIKNFDKTIDYILNNNLLDQYSLYNINFPTIDGEIAITKQGSTNFDTKIILKNNQYHQLGNPQHHLENNNETDVHAIENNNISITPLTVDRTCHETFNKLKIT